jgi:hypothetical protein
VRWGSGGEAPPDRCGSHVRKRSLPRRRAHIQTPPFERLLATS